MGDKDDDTKQKQKEAADLPSPLKLQSGPNASTPLLFSRKNSRQQLLLSSIANYSTMSLTPTSGGVSFHASVDNSLTRSTRKPFHYPVNKQFIGHPALTEDGDIDASATYNRHRYYSRLIGSQPEDLNILRVPDHILPFHFVIPQLPFKRFSVKHSSDGKQSSVLTIFAIWNMLMGSTLLCLPWALHQAGLYCGIVVMLFMLFVSFYTANLIVTIPRLVPFKCPEFSDVCALLLGRWALVLCHFFSQISLLGTCVVYWILMTNFLFHIVSYVFEISANNSTSTMSWSGSDDVFCELNPADDDAQNSTNFFETLKSCTSDPKMSTSDMFYKLWDQQLTAPFALGLVLIPLIFIKSPSVFMKFNAFGTVSVVLLLSFVSFKAFKWGFWNVNLVDESNMFYTPVFQWSFPIQSGILSQALFIHNCIQTVLQLQRKPENNSRDLGVAFGLVGLTYFAIALFIYLAFPLAKVCILDNFLDNFQSSDLPAFFARVVMFFQLLCLFPLYCYMLRSQVFHMIFSGPTDATFLRLLIFNLLVASVSILFAMYIPRIGTIIRFVGAISGLILIFALPPIAYLRALQVRARANSPDTDSDASSAAALKCSSAVKGIPIWRLIFHIFLVLFGIANCAAQFFY